MAISIAVSGFTMDEMTCGALEKVKASTKVILHTERCALGDWLKENGIPFRSLDSLYESAPDFDAHTEMAVKLVEEASDCVFSVMDTGDETAKALMKRHPDITVYGGPFDALILLSESRLISLTAIDAVSAALQPLSSTLIKEIDTRFLAGDVKLRLESVYGEDSMVFFRNPQGRIIRLKLCDLDRLKSYDHTCACLINPSGAPQTPDFECLRLILASKAVKLENIDVEAIAKQLADVVKSLNAAEENMLFDQNELFSLAAQILTEGDQA